MAAKVVPSTDQARNVALMNLGTFIGAVCFLVGALLLLPERTNPDRPDPGTPDESRFHPPGVMPGEA